MISITIDSFRALSQPNIHLCKHVELVHIVSRESNLSLPQRANRSIRYHTYLRVGALKYSELQKHAVVCHNFHA